MYFVILYDVVLDLSCILYLNIKIVKLQSQILMKYNNQVEL